MPPFLYFEAKNIYLLGLDFATDQETGQTHADIHSHTRKVDLQLNEEVGGGVEAKNEIIEIEGNFQDKVYTSLLFDAMRRECNAISATYKTDKSHSFNLSNGAKIESTTPLQPTDITLDETIDKHKLYKELREIFDARSENFLTEKEREDIQKRLEYYDSVI